MLDQDPDAPVARVDFPHPSDPLGPRQRWRLSRPQRWLVAHDAGQVPGLLDAVHALSKQGLWAVGWVAYEAAPGLDPTLPVKALPVGQPYAVWAVFDPADVQADEPATTEVPEAPETTEAAWQAGPWQGDLADTEMHARVERVRELIRDGEVYQVNLTHQLHSGFTGGPAAISAYFDALRRSQPAAFSLMLDARAACRGPGVLLSVSPELFFDWDGHTLTTRPMKGTAARHADPQRDQDAARHLRTSAKERAENLMIVDLLRNDLSRVAEVGSVAVPSLFDVQALPTVWQMTSTITARSRPGLTLSQAFTALFPCGSVTGAPKRQAMHHIARLERGPRGVYCGAVGLMAPGGHVTFNVPIRTVVLHTPPPPAPWHAHCGIGSGITLDSQPAAEWAEWQAKQVFLRRADQPFQLLESLRLEDGHIARIDAHLARIEASARHFQWPWQPAWRARIDAALQALAQAHPQGLWKARLLLGPQGQLETQAAPLPAPPAHPLTVALASQPMPAADDFIRHKTTRRQAYAEHTAPAGCFDTLLYNERDELTEFTIGNVALRLDGQWWTPPLSAGLLPGVMRAALLAEGRLHERALTRDDLARAEGLALVNSVRGWVPVRLASSASAAPTP